METAKKVEKINAMIKHINIAMLTTVNKDGSLRSRPMATQEVQADGTVWFFISRISHKAQEIASHHTVNLAYARPSDENYVSVSGMASILDDKAKMKDLWKPAYYAWFPEGLESSDIALLKVDIEKVEYWNGPSNVITQIIEFSKAIISGKQFQGGPDTHGSVDLNHH